jgi:hypothetical protein
MITCLSQNFEKFVEKNEIFCQKSLNIENQTFEVLKKISMQNDTLISQNNELKELLKIKNDPFGLNINNNSRIIKSTMNDSGLGLDNEIYKTPSSSQFKQTNYS